MATMMEDELGLAPHVIGDVLNHDLKAYKGITATYTVGKLINDRRSTMNAWGRKLESVLDPADGSNLVRRKKAEQ